MVAAKGNRKYRRSASLVLYWQDGELVFENFALRTRISTDPLLCSILHYCGEWRTTRQIASHLGDRDGDSVRKILDRLCGHGALERSGQKRDSRLAAMECWASWNPAAGFFHFSTKDTDFTTDPKGAFEDLKRRTLRDPMPLPLKHYSHARRTKLPRIAHRGHVPALLKSRRTWRKYGPGPVTLEAFSQLLELTFGIQGWVDIPGLGRAALKTSPSGGDLHPIETYVLVQRVRGLRPGVYHYNADRHELEWLHNPISKSSLQRALASQWWFARAAFLVLMTAVFTRTQWKYDFPRSYRVVLAEAGHLCQTFCLTATWLGLAPFCTMALTDTKWEQWLGIDGIRESILYVAGAGTLPSSPRDQRNANILTSGTLVG